MVNSSGGVGLAVIGCGTIGRIRARLAREHPAVTWLGLCDVDGDLSEKLAHDVGGDFHTTDLRELLARPEVDAVVIATDENNHVDPIDAAIEAGHAILIEKPLATSVIESARIAATIEERGIDAVMGYTLRFSRQFLGPRESIQTNQIGEVTTMVTRAFMNRMPPLATLQRTSERGALTPMVVSGTHSLDLCLWLLEGLPGKTPVDVYARSVTGALAEDGTKDATLGIFTFDDGSLWSMSINWALPASWPAAVYGLQIGVVGTRGVVDIDDTHRDVIVASEIPRGASYNPKGFDVPLNRHVDFLGTYLPGDMSGGDLWGPMRDETTLWLNSLVTGKRLHHATAAEGHRNLLLTMAMDKSARTGEAIKLPVAVDDLMDA